MRIRSRLASPFLSEHFVVGTVHGVVGCSASCGATCWGRPRARCTESRRRTIARYVTTARWVRVTPLVTDWDQIWNLHD